MTDDVAFYDKIASIVSNRVNCGCRHYKVTGSKISKKSDNKHIRVKKWTDRTILIAKQHKGEFVKIVFRTTDGDLRLAERKFSKGHIEDQWNISCHTMISRKKYRFDICPAPDITLQNETPTSVSKERFNAIVLEQYIKIAQNNAWHQQMQHSTQQPSPKMTKTHEKQAARDTLTHDILRDILPAHISTEPPQ